MCATRDYIILFVALACLASPKEMCVATSVIRGRQCSKLSKAYALNGSESCLQSYILLHRSAQLSPYCLEQYVDCDPLQKRLAAFSVDSNILNVIFLHLNCLDKLGGLSRILLESECMDFASKWICHILERTSQVLLVIESSGIKFDHLNCIHFSHSVVHLLKQVLV